MGSLVGTSSGYLESLPVPVQNRIEFLRELDASRAELEDEFDEEMRKLEAAYTAKFAPLDRQLRSVVQGKEEVPANKETEIPADCPTGIPLFWLTALRSDPQLEERITEKDAEVLVYLTDVTSEPVVGEEDGDSFTLIFTFADNPFFTNKTLKKTYYMADDDDLMLEKVSSDRVNWKAGKDVTVKVMKKKLRPGQKGTPATKVQSVDSFFNWFDPPQIPEDDENMDEEEMEQLQDAMEADFMLAEIINEKILPHPLKYFTGENLQDEDEDDEDEDEDDEDDEEDSEEDSEDDDEEDSEDEEDARPQARARGGRGSRPAGAVRGGRR